MGAGYGVNFLAMLSRQLGFGANCPRMSPASGIVEDVVCIFFLPEERKEAGLLRQRQRGMSGEFGVLNLTDLTDGKAAEAHRQQPLPLDFLNFKLSVVDHSA